MPDDETPSGKGTAGSSGTDEPDDRKPTAGAGKPSAPRKRRAASHTPTPRTAPDATAETVRDATVATATAAMSAATPETTPDATVEMPAATADTVSLPAAPAPGPASESPGSGSQAPAVTAPAPPANGAVAATGAGPARGPRWRRIVAVVLIVVATLLAPLVLEVTWMNRDLLNTNNYVSTVAPLASNPGVQTAVARNLTDQLWAKVDVTGQLSGVLPSWAQVFAGPLSNTLKGYAYQATHAAVSSKAFATVWEKANRTAHNQVRNVLLGSPGGAVKSSNGEVSLDLSPLADQIKATLDSKGIHALDSVSLPPGSATFVIFRSATLAKAQKTVKVLHSLSVALPLLLIAAWAGAIAVSLRRRRTILQLGFTLALAMVVTLVAYHLGRGLYLNAVSSPQLPRDTAASIFDTLMRGMLGPAKTVLVVGFVIWLGALVMGPARWAVSLRSMLSGGIDTAGSAAEARGLDLGPFGSWVARHRHALQIAGLVVAAAVLVFWGTPGVAGVLWIVVALLVFVALVEFVGRLTAPSAS